MKTPSNEAEKLRREISERESPKSRLPVALRARCEGYAGRRAAAGAVPRSIAADLGVSEMTVRRWLQRLLASGVEE